MSFIAKVVVEVYVFGIKYIAIGVNSTKQDMEEEEDQEECTHCVYMQNGGPHLFAHGSTQCIHISRENIMN